MSDGMQITITIPAPIRWLFSFWGVLSLIMCNALALALIGHPPAVRPASALDHLMTYLSLFGVANGLFLLYLIMASFRIKKSSQETVA
jgi:hypothetical protein